MDILSEKELADLLDISPWTVRGWRIKSGLPHFRIGIRVFYRLESVERWIQENEMRHTNDWNGTRAVCP